MGSLFDAFRPQRDEYVTQQPGYPDNTVERRQPMSPQGALVRQGQLQDINAQLNQPTYGSDGFGGDMYNSFAGAGDRLLTETLPGFMDGAVDFLTPDNMPNGAIANASQATADWLRGQSNGTYGMSEAYGGYENYDPRKFLPDTMQAIPGFAAQIATKGPLAGAAMGFAQMFGNKYNETGDPYRSAVTAGSLSAIDKIGLDKFFKGGAKWYDKGATEAFSEMAQIPGEAAIDYGYTGEGKSIGELYSEAESSAIPSFLLGSAGAGIDVNARDAGQRIMSDADQLGTAMRSIGSAGMAAAQDMITPPATPAVVGDVARTPGINIGDVSVGGIGDDVGDQTTSEMLIGEQGSGRLPGKKTAEFARQLEGEGKTMTEIQKETGWLRNVDNNWVREIDDSGMEYQANAEDDIRASGKTTGMITDLVDHPELFKAYPGMSWTQADIVIDDSYSGKAANGSFEPARRGGSPKITIRAGTKKEALSVLSHEIQHNVQAEEGHAGGSSVAAQGEMYTESAHSAKQMAKKKQAIDNQFPMEEGSRERLQAEEKQIRLDVKSLMAENDGDSTDQKERYNALREKQQEIGYKLGKGYMETRELSPFDRYQADAGEIPARQVEDRRTLSMEQRDKKPLFGGVDNVAHNDLLSESKMSDEQKAAFKKSTGVEHDDVTGKMKVNREPSWSEQEETPKQETSQLKPSQPTGAVEHDMDITQGQRKTISKAPLSADEKSKLGGDSKKIKTVSNYKKDHPQSDGWRPIKIKGLTKKGLIEYEKQPYGYNIDPKTGKDTPATRPARVKKMGRKLIKEYREIERRAAEGDKAAQVMLEQAKWYSDTRRSFRREFGASGDLLADLFGGLSPRAKVKGNWKDAKTAIQNFARGKYEKQLRELSKHIDNGGNKNNFPDEFMIRKPNGAKYNMNGYNAMLGMLDTWRVIKPNSAPKAKNFSGNVIGRTNDPTIDVWAGRLLARLDGQKRIPPAAEQAVTGEHSKKDISKIGGEFGFGSSAFKQAAKAIGIKPDALQAVAWFLEKEVWTKGGWTTDKESEGGSVQQEILDNPETGYIVGVSPQRTRKATDRRMEKGRKALLEVLQNDDSVISFKAPNTEGIYAGDSERSYDMEFTTTKDFKPENIIDTLAKFGVDFEQYDIFISRKLKPTEKSKNSRPGMEVYFKDDINVEEMAGVTDQLAKLGFDGYTISRDGRNTNKRGRKQNNPRGLKIQFIPELMMRFDEGARKRYEKNPNLVYEDIAKNAEIMAEAIEVLDKENLQDAFVQNYDTLVIGKENYAEYRLNKDGNGGAGGDAKKAQKKPQKSASEAVGQRANDLNKE